MDNYHLSPTAEGWLLTEGLSAPKPGLPESLLEWSPEGRAST